MAVELPPDRLTAAIINQLRAFEITDSRYGLIQFQSLVSAHQYQKLYQLCQRYLPAEGQLLDWGCGNGHFSYYLLQQGYQVQGFSFAPCPLIDHLRSANYQFHQAQTADPVALPYEDGQFAAIFSVGVLEHVREGGGDEIASLQEIGRILRPGGYFICYHFPNLFSWIERLAAKLPHKYHHQYRYTEPMIRNLCEQSGLGLSAVSLYGILPRNIASKLPAALANHPRCAQVWDACDDWLSARWPNFCQNYYFVAQKPPIP